jgi:hypothetical protein
MTHLPNIAYRVQEVTYGGTAHAQEVNDELKVTTICEVCRSEMRTSYPKGYPAGTKGLSEAVAEPVTVICACGYPHDGRPAESSEVGCGAFWTVEVTAS